jgi:hypothetical protein
VRALTSREIVVELLRTYADACGPGELGEGSDGADDRLLLMSRLWHQGSYRELGRCLLIMRAREPRLYWHTAHRYLRVTTRITLGCPGCGKATREGTRHTHHDGFRSRRFERGRIVEERWHPRVDLRLVDEGIAWLVREHRGPPQLPPELFALVAA